MFLRTLFLHHFRPYREASFDFCSDINAILGPNAKGKTSLLEAIYFLITGSSFRTSQASDLIHLGQPYFYLEATFVKHGIEQTLKIHCSHKERKIIHNSTPCPSSAGLLGLLQGVMVAPDDLALVKGGPQERRQFLDLQIAQADPLYVHHLTRYHRAMRQRNCLLKSKNSASIDSWEYEMSNAAAYLVRQRAIALQDLQINSKPLYEMFCGGQEDNLVLIYRTGAPNPIAESHDNLKQYHLQQLQKLRRREMELGFTLSGPHKDDFLIAIGDREVRFFASEGQQRSCVAALRLAEWERLYRLAGEAPLMLIDDVGVSLDGQRRERLLNHLCSLGQVLVTSTEQLPLQRDASQGNGSKSNESQGDGRKSNESQGDGSKVSKVQSRNVQIISL